MKCHTCDSELFYSVNNGAESSTLVGYMSPPGHDHDDNCVSRRYECENGHIITVSKRNKCSNPDCDWVGREKCFCHHGKKVEEWPDV